MATFWKLVLHKAIACTATRELKSPHFYGTLNSHTLNYYYIKVLAWHSKPEPLVFRRVYFLKANGIFTCSSSPDSMVVCVCLVWRKKGLNQGKLCSWKNWISPFKSPSLYFEAYGLNLFVGESPLFWFIFSLERRHDTSSRKWISSWLKIWIYLLSLAFIFCNALSVSCKIMTSCCVQMRHSFVFKSPHKLHHKDDDDAGQSKGKQGLQHQQLLMEKWEKETTWLSSSHQSCYISFIYQHCSPY